MVNRSNLIVCYIQHNSGGAYSIKWENVKSNLLICLGKYSSNPLWFVSFFFSTYKTNGQFGTFNISSSLLIPILLYNVASCFVNIAFCYIMHKGIHFFWPLPYIQLIMVQAKRSVWQFFRHNFHYLILIFKRNDNHLQKISQLHFIFYLNW